MTGKVSALYLDGVQHVQDVTWLVSGAGLPHTLAVLMQSADKREVMGHPPEFIRGVRESVDALCAFHGLVIDGAVTESFHCNEIVPLI